MVTPEPLKSIGEIVQLSVNSNMSDGSSRMVRNELVQWKSSDLSVVTVSEGVVTAVGPGNATVTAIYDGRKMETPISVRISAQETGTVRVLYAAPSDREFRDDYSEGITHALVDVQSWLRRELHGLTFSLHESSPEFCRMSEASDFYAQGNAWDKVVAGVQHCAPVKEGDSEYVWIIYADVEEACDDHEDLGAGAPSLTIVPRWDLEGLANPGEYWYCADGPYNDPLGRWIGGIAHELAHSLGLPHPPGCDEELPTCDEPALMWFGYSTYPDTYLRPDEKEALMRSSFIGGNRGSTHGPTSSSSELKIQGTVQDSSGEPLEGSRVSLITEKFWNWGKTGQDGSFEVRVPRNFSDSSILSIHAGSGTDCGWLGYYGPAGFTTLHANAKRVEAGSTDVEIRLPFDMDETCGNRRKVTGTVSGPDDNPAEGILIEAFDEWRLTERGGTFEFDVPESWIEPVILSVYVSEVADCDLVGHYGPGGFTTVRREGEVEVVVGGVSGVEIRLPDTPDELCRRQSILTGMVLGPTGEPMEGIVIWFWFESTGYGGESGRDGRFEIKLLEGWKGQSVLSIDVAGCGSVGYYNEEYGFTPRDEDASRVDVGDSDVTGIEIRLPVDPDDLCNRRGR
ncbi:MAG: Ig-like domain-containing protein [Dehalococcoidia bacterium]|nr:Ig-like domain-containing protein [Dehalococcoidia bacterium]